MEKPKSIQVILAYLFMGMLIIFFVKSQNLKTSKITMNIDNVDINIEKFIIESMDTLCNSDIKNINNLFFIDSSMVDNMLKKFENFNKYVQDNNLVVKNIKINKEQQRHVKKDERTYYEYLGEISYDIEKDNKKNLGKVKKDVLIYLYTDDFKTFKLTNISFLNDNVK